MVRGKSVLPGSVVDVHIPHCRGRQASAIALSLCLCLCLLLPCCCCCQGVDISPFINNLPGGTPTNTFRSDDASGSTSQAANIQVGPATTAQPFKPVRLSRGFGILEQRHA
jgi:hypothetical protein